ncbi:hypothetical protein [Streptomyces sp. NPDC058664]|uniref:hypothetical protein n=1 Tax=unclassified Streptomyces TaxID=2593676 RepID=UPI00365D70A7
MSESVIQSLGGGLITLEAADALWVELTTGDAVPTAFAAFPCSPSRVRVGYVLLGSHVVAMVKASGGRWSVVESEVRRAAELNAVETDGQDLVRIGPFRSVPQQEHTEGALLRWRERIARELGEPAGTG